MRNTKYKPFFDPILAFLHQQMDICGIVRNHFIALSRRYYRMYRKGLSYKQMSAHLTKLKKREKYKHWHIPYAWSLQQVIRDLARSYQVLGTKMTIPAQTLHEFCKKQQQFCKSPHRFCKEI